ncbi:NAD(P)-dependent oxidoreductase [Pelagibacterales bacterium SAG-MED18]|nr:NAD(P)-dependent oxidoreductase [Pelagibacterales bacterium SAG-MED18]
MHKILLTGYSGFIGSEILNQLSKNNTIYITQRNKKKIKNKNIQNIKQIYFKNYDNLNYKLSKLKIDIVIHCATHYIKNHTSKDIKKLSDSNILFGNIILENLRSMNVKKFIYFNTVWENYNSIKKNYFNLYAVYKSIFKELIDYYKKNLTFIKFYNLSISDTFGELDKRKKIINVLKSNYKKNKSTKILSKNLYLNLLNVEDIIEAVKILINKNYKSDEYILKNSKNFSLKEIVDRINKSSKKKIKVKWVSNKTIKEKLFKSNRLKNWKPRKSNIRDIVNTIKK